MEQVAQITTFARDTEAAGLAQRLRELVGRGAIVNSQSIAPANAHPEVLKNATEVVGSNDEDGIVRYLLDCHSLSCDRVP